MNIDSSKTKADIYLPSGDKIAYPTILMLHGGGGNPMNMAKIANYFMERGYAIVAAGYRDMPHFKYPRAIQDVFCAYAWIHQNATEYHFDLENIFVLGYSAGGTYGAMLGVINDPTPYTENCPIPFPKDKELKGVITFTGIFDYKTAYGLSSSLDDYLTEYFGTSFEQDSEIWIEASPAVHVDGSEPPFLLFHGQDDTSIAPSQSEEFARALQAAGVENELMLIEGANHVQIISSAEAFQITETFLATQIK
jgi:acetyl esterase/lipase